jgi:hypothetical protein
MITLQSGALDEIVLFSNASDCAAYRPQRSRSAYGCSWKVDLTQISHPSGVIERLSHEVVQWRSPALGLADREWIFRCIYDDRRMLYR